MRRQVGARRRFRCEPLRPSRGGIRRTGGMGPARPVLDAVSWPVSAATGRTRLAGHYAPARTVGTAMSTLTASSIGNTSTKEQDRRFPCSPTAVANRTVVVWLQPDRLSAPNQTVAARAFRHSPYLTGFMEPWAQSVSGVSLAPPQNKAGETPPRLIGVDRLCRRELRSGVFRSMEMNGMSLNSIKSRTRTVIATSHVKARRFGTLAGLAIAASIASGALLAQAPQAIGTWVSVGEVSAPLANGAIVALPDKRTLIAGGKLADGTLTDAVTIYDPVDNSAIAAGTLTSARMDHTATLLKDGRVLVVGGITADGLVSNDIEVFDPATGTSTIVALLPEPRNGHVAAALLDGTVLIAGGATVDGACCRQRSFSILRQPACLPYRPSCTALAFMLRRRRCSTGASSWWAAATGRRTSRQRKSTTRYSQSFSMAATQMSVGRQGHSAVLLPEQRRSPRRWRHLERRGPGGR